MAYDKKDKPKVNYKDFNFIFNKYDESAKGEEDLKYWRTGVLAFDMLTKGKGLPEGTLSIYSKSGNGKTTLTYSIVQNLCDMGVPVIFAAVEPSLKLRVDMGITGKYPVETLRVVDVLYYNEIQEVVGSFFYSPYKVLVIDSLTALSMGVDTFLNKPLEDSRKIGEDAGPQTQLCRFLSGQCKRTGKTVIYICQTRKDIITSMHGGQGGGDKQAGAEAVFFYPDMTVKMYGSEKFTAEELFGIKETQIVASKGFLSADKNRHAPPFVKIPFYCLFGKGVSNREMIKIWMKWKQMYSVGGAWYKVFWQGAEVKINGKKEFNSWITANYSSLADLFYKDTEAFFKYFEDEKAYTNFMAADIDDVDKVEKSKTKALKDLVEIREAEDELKKELSVKEKEIEVSEDIVQEAL
jgi:RecA/RadA recombinase